MNKIKTAAIPAAEFYNQKVASGLDFSQFFMGFSPVLVLNPVPTYVEKEPIIPEIILPDRSSSIFSPKNSFATPVFEPEKASTSKTSESQPDTLVIESYQLINNQLVKTGFLVILVIILSLILIVPTAGGSLLLGLIGLIFLTISSKKNTKQKIMNNFNFTEEEANEIVKNFHQLSIKEKEELFKTLRTNK